MPQVTRVLAIAAICIACSAASFALFSVLNQRAKATLAVSKAVCLSQNKTNDQFRTLLAFFEGRSLLQPGLTQDQRNNITSFYAGALAKLPSQTVC